MSAAAVVEAEAEAPESSSLNSAFWTMGSTAWPASANQGAHTDSKNQHETQETMQSPIAYTSLDFLLLSFSCR